MPNALNMLPQLAPLLARHLAAYVELAAADAALLARSLARRLLAAAVALVGAVFALQLACVWIVAAAWDTPWRWRAPALLMMLFLMLAAVGAVAATRRRGAVAGAISTLSEEWASDQKLIQELSGSTADTSVPATSPLLRLRQSRSELRAMLHATEGQAVNGRFPRSTTMRLLNLIPVASLTRMLFKS